MADTKKMTHFILDDIRIKLGDEFDRNFERQAFFNEKWARNKQPSRNHPLVLSGGLRRSIRSRTSSDSVEFYSELPYAALHNDGGTLTVSDSMKRAFWARMYESKNKEDKEYFRRLALMKVGTVIKIPRRRFIGFSDEVVKLCRSVIFGKLTETFSDFKAISE